MFHLLLCPYLSFISILFLDSKSNCKLLKILLLQRGVQVCDSCFDGAEALEIVLRKEPARPVTHYDIIFMDSNMPKMVSIYILLSRISEEYILLYVYTNVLWLFYDSYVCFTFIVNTNLLTHYSLLSSCLVD